MRALVDLGGGVPRAVAQHLGEGRGLRLDEDPPPAERILEEVADAADAAVDVWRGAGVGRERGVGREAL